MELDVKLRFPTEKAAAILEWLSSLPYGAVELQSRAAAESTANPLVAPVDEAELERRFFALFGAWKSDGETGDDLNRMLQEARYTEQRDIEL
jgi:hypothetical protein